MLQWKHIFKHVLLGIDFFDSYNFVKYNWCLLYILLHEKYQEINWKIKILVIKTSLCKKKKVGILKSNFLNLINNPKMFNGLLFDLAEKPYIPQKILLQWICCKCLAGCYRHSYFWPQRSWRLLEAKNTPWRPKTAWRSWFIETSV